MLSDPEKDANCPTNSRAKKTPAKPFERAASPWVGSNSLPGRFDDRQELLNVRVRSRFRQLIRSRPAAADEGAEVQVRLVRIEAAVGSADRRVAVPLVEWRALGAEDLHLQLLQRLHRLL